MRKYFLIYGGLAGAIIALSMFIGYFAMGADQMVGDASGDPAAPTSAAGAESGEISAWNEESSSGVSIGISEWLGYLFMLVALSVIFIGVKRYRDQELGGVIRFGTAFLLGLGMSLVACALYVAAWEVSLKLTDYAFINDYTAAVIAQKKAEGLAGAELEAFIEQQEVYKERYGKAFYRLPITFIEMFPVGLVVTLLSALILRRSEVLPAN